MGELILDYNKRNSPITWNRIVEFNQGHLLVYLANPKVTANKLGHVKDIFSFPDKLYCPVEALSQLFLTQKREKRFSNSGQIFVLSDLKPLNMHMVNKLLHTLSQYITGVNYSCHSLRAAIPTLMALKPSKFSVEEMEAVGPWASDAFKAYCKQNGAAARDIHKKIVGCLAR